MTKIKLPKSPAERQRRIKDNSSLSFQDLSKQLVSIVSDLNSKINTTIDTDNTSKLYTYEEVNDLVASSTYDLNAKLLAYENIEKNYKNSIVKLEATISDLRKELAIKEGVIDVLKTIEIKTSNNYTQQHVTKDTVRYERPKIGGQIVIDPSDVNKLDSHINIKETSIKDEELNKGIIDNKLSKLKKLLG